MTTVPIVFQSEGTLFRIKKVKVLRNWILDTCTREHKELGEISYIFCSDEYLHSINLEYLEHDTYTDIVTFDYGVGELVSGDLFISIDRIRENAKKFGQKVEDELHRVMIHGVLHLIGYKDKKPAEQAEMTEKEDFYLSLRTF